MASSSAPTSYIESLPPELLRSILTHWDDLFDIPLSDGFLTNGKPATSVVQATAYYNALFRIRRVSRHFLNVIDSCALLWRRMDYTVPPQQRNLIWAKSEGLLDIDCTSLGTGPDDWKTPPEQMAYIQDLLSQSSRWKTIHVSQGMTNRVQEFYGQILSAPAPLLEYFGINAHAPFGMQTAIDFDQVPFADTAAPRRVMLKGLHTKFPWTARFTSQIEELYIQDYSIFVEKSSSRIPLFDAISQGKLFGNLRELVVDTFFLQCRQQITSSLVSLPRLEHLRVIGVLGEQLRDTFKHVRAPRASLTLHAITFENAQSDSLPWTAQWFGSQLPVQTDARYGGDEVVLQADSQSGIEYMLMDNNGAKKRQCRLLLIAPASAEIYCTVFEHAPEEWRRSIRSLAVNPSMAIKMTLGELISAVQPFLVNVTSLTVGNEQAYASIANALEGDNADGTLPFQALQRLDIFLQQDQTGLDTLIEAIARRGSLTSITLRITGKFRLNVDVHESPETGILAPNSPWLPTRRAYCRKTFEIAHQQLQLHGHHEQSNSNGSVASS